MFCNECGERGGFHHRGCRNEVLTLTPQREAELRENPDASEFDVDCLLKEIEKLRTSTRRMLEALIAVRRECQLPSHIEEIVGDAIAEAEARP